MVLHPHPQPRVRRGHGYGYGCGWGARTPAAVPHAPAPPGLTPHAPPTYSTTPSARQKGCIDSGASQHALPQDIQEMDDSDTTCSYCGISYLIHREVQILKGKVGSLEQQLEEYKEAATKGFVWRDELNDATAVAAQQAARANDLAARLAASHGVLRQLRTQFSASLGEQRGALAAVRPALAACQQAMQAGASDTAAAMAKVTARVDKLRADNLAEQAQLHATLEARGKELAAANAIARALTGDVAAATAAGEAALSRAMAQQKELHERRLEQATRSGEQAKALLQSTRDEASKLEAKLRGASMSTAGLQERVAAAEQAVRAKTVEAEHVRAKLEVVAVSEVGLKQRVAELEQENGELQVQGATAEKLCQNLRAKADAAGSQSRASLDQLGKTLQERNGRIKGLEQQVGDLGRQLAGFGGAKETEEELRQALAVAQRQCNEQREAKAREAKAREAEAEQLMDSIAQQVRGRSPHSLAFGASAVVAPRLRDGARGAGSCHPCAVSYALPLPPVCRAPPVFNPPRSTSSLPCNAC